MDPERDNSRHFGWSAPNRPTDNFTSDKLRPQYPQQLRYSDTRTCLASDAPVPDSSSQSLHRYHPICDPQGYSYCHYSSEEFCQRGFTFTYVGAPSQPSDYGVGSFERIPQYDEIPDLNMLYIQTHNQGNFMVDACNGLRSTTSTDVIPTSPVATSGPNDCSVFSAAETNMLPPLYPLTSPLLPALSSDVPGDGEPISSPPKVPSAPHSPIQYADAYTSAAPAWRYHISALEPVTIQEEAGNLFSPSLRSCLEPYRTMPSISAYGAMPPERRSEAPCSYAIEDSQGYRVSASRSQTSNRTASATASRTQSGLSSAAYAWPCKMCGIVIARRQDLIRHQKSVHERTCASRCLACNRVLSRGDALRRHIREHLFCSRFYITNGQSDFTLSTRNTPRRSSGKRQSSSGTFDSHCDTLGLN